jgi:hypothetical protein
MKVYELRFRDGDNFDESSFVLWVKTDRHLEAPGAVKCKEIEIDEPGMTPLIDLIISSKNISFDPGELTKDNVRKALYFSDKMINELTGDDIATIYKALANYMTSELTEDNVVTVRKTLIKDIIIDLRKTLITDTGHASVGRVKDMHSDIVKAVDRLYQILNEEIS